MFQDLGLMLKVYVSGIGVNAEVRAVRGGVKYVCVKRPAFESFMLAY